MELRADDDLWWTADLRISSWAGYSAREPDASGAQPLSDGTVSLIFAPEGRGIDPLTAQEMALLDWFEAHEPAVSDAVKAALVHWCAPDATDRAERFDFGDDFPEIRSEADLARNIELSEINVHQVKHGGLPYVGYLFGCRWDDEHGLGILMHGTRVVDIGGADTAILLWIAEEDAENR